MRQIALARLLAFVLFHVLILGILLFWLFENKNVDLETIRRTLQSLTASEATLLGLFLATIAFSMNMTVTQLQRLEPHKNSFLQTIGETKGIGEAIDEVLQNYKVRFLAQKSLPKEVKYPYISHMSNGEFFVYFEEFVKFVRWKESVPLQNGGTVTAPEVDMIRLFRIACAFLLSEECAKRDIHDPVFLLSRRLGELERTYNIVTIINNVYDIRRAGRRSLPLFMFLLILSWLGSVVVLSVSTADNFNVGLYNLAVVPIFPIAYGFGYYAFQILNRYLEN